jgi:hypothetical protein
MPKYIFQFLLICFCLVTTIKAQSFEQLDSLKDHKVKIYFSAGHGARAKAIAMSVDKAMDHYVQLLGFKPTVTLLILSSADWNKYTSLAVYGMPHYRSDKILVVAAEFYTATGTVARRSARESRSSLS